MDQRKRALFLSLFTQELIHHSKPKIEAKIPEQVRENYFPAPIPKIIPPPREEVSKITIRPYDPLSEVPAPTRPSRPNVPLRINLPPIPPTRIPKRRIHPETLPKIQPKIPQNNYQKQVMQPSRKLPLSELRSIGQFKEPIGLTKEKIKIPFQTIQKEYPPQDAKLKLKAESGKRPEPKRIDLGKLNVFLPDKEITTIECPGPGKFILIKKGGKINLTRVKLSKEEIDTIVKNFAEKARIPLLGGVFKAVIDDLSINAVTSDVVGSRFIIYRKTPYSIVDQ